MINTINIYPQGQDVTANAEFDFTIGDSEEVGDILQTLVVNNLKQQYSNKLPQGKYRLHLLASIVNVDET